MDANDVARIVAERRAAQPAPPEPVRIDKLLLEVLERIQSRPAAPINPPAWFNAPTPERCAATDHMLRFRRIAALVSQVGRRYEKVTLRNFELETDEQRETVAALASYGQQFREHAIQGDGVLLFGPSGTGKDHLLIGLAKLVICHWGASVWWRYGLDLFAEARDGISSEASEVQAIRHYAKPDVLILSDPVRPGGTLTDGQADLLIRIIDKRLRECRPTWYTLNVASGAEADARLGPAIKDRLMHGTLVRFCGWPSYRAKKARGI